MTPQSKKKLAAVIATIAAVLSALLLGGVIPDGYHKYIEGAIIALGAILTNLPAIFGDVPAVAMVPVVPVIAQPPDHETPGKP